MLVNYSDKVNELRARVEKFMDDHIYQHTRRYAELEATGQINDPDAIAFVQELRMRAKEEGLWNLFFPHLRDDEPGHGLSNLEFAPIFEIMGKVFWAPEVFNCNAPNTGNMELLHFAANEEQRQKWLRPLLEGECTSCFAMTEPDVASSDATNIQTSIVRNGDEYVINGRKWFISRAMHPDCRFAILLGKTDPNNPNRHLQQTMLVVPMDSPGLQIIRDTTVLNGHHSGGHPELLLRNVRVPVANRLGEEGHGFAVMQSRMGPGRIHYGMRAIGMAEVAMQLMTSRSKERVAFGKHLHQHGMTAQAIARSRIEIDQARLLCLNTAKTLDEVGVKAARKEIAMIKIVGSELVKNVSERAIRVHGAMGLSNQTPLAEMLTWSWVMGIGDGPNEVHLEAIAKMEVRDNDSAASVKHYLTPES